jgi:hypothetical protein
VTSKTGHFALRRYVSHFHSTQCFVRIIRRAIMDVLVDVVSRIHLHQSCHVADCSHSWGRAKSYRDLISTMNPWFASIAIVRRRLSIATDTTFGIQSLFGVNPMPVLKSGGAAVAPWIRSLSCRNEDRKCEFLQPLEIRRSVGEDLRKFDCRSSTRPGMTKVDMFSARATRYFFVHRALLVPPS